MKLDDAAVIAMLRSSEPLDAVCRKAGVTQPAFEAARDACLAARSQVLAVPAAGALTAPVEILRDRAGVPHIYAASTPDLFFGLGVAMAQDRLWQMDRLRRRALGRQAEILGPAYLSSDIAHLTVGIDEIAAREVSEMDPATRGIVESFVAGINHQLAAMHGRLPIEFALLDYEPDAFSVRDIVAIGRGIWWSLNGRIDRIVAAEAARFLPTQALRSHYLTPEASENLVLPSDDQGSTGPVASGTDDCTGSNNWALSGDHTASGHPLLCGDPHQPFWVPSSWYEFALHGPDDDAAGAGHPGLPGMWWGSNGTTAWGITNNAASTRDLYRETVHPDDPGLYRDGDTWRRFGERQLEIPVKGAAAHRLTVRTTVRGPVVNGLVTAVAEEGDPPLSLRWVGAEHLDDIRAMVGISRARSWPAFRAALQDWAIAVFNFVYADGSGTIGYQMAGRIPRRERLTGGFRDANDPANHWQGYIAFENLPRSCNPSRGYVASANQRIVEPDAKRPIYGAYSQGHRGVRIDQILAAEPRLDRAANIRFQNDVKSCRAERMCPHVIGALAGSTDPDAVMVRSALAGWGFDYTMASTAATIFETFMAHWQRAVLSVHLPQRLLDLTSQQTGLAVALLEGAEPDYFANGTNSMAIEVARRAVAALRDRLGPDPAAWSWGRVHIAHWKHAAATPALGGALDVGPAPVDGGSHTIRNTGGELPPHAASSGAEYRIVMDFAAPRSFLAVQNIGNSGVPGSPHYRDQFEPWLQGAYHAVYLDRADLEKDGVATTVIAPA
jgi:penicillin G amidase